MKKQILFFLVMLFCFASCRRQEATGVVVEANPEEKEVYDPFVEGNQKIVALEDEEIELFIKRYGWKTEKTGTGLRIEIVREGTGDFVKEGETVTLKYQTMLLNGDVVYQSSVDGDMTFTVGKTNELIGLHEAAKYMKKDCKARVVIPAHLAYGVGGDGNRIVGRKPIAMYLELIDKK